MRVLDLLELLFHPLLLLSHDLDHRLLLLSFGYLPLRIEGIHIVIVNFLAKLILVRLEYFEYLLQIWLVLVHVLEYLLVLLILLVEIAFYLSFDAVGYELRIIVDPA